MWMHTNVKLPWAAMKPLIQPLVLSAVSSEGDLDLTSNTKNCTKCISVQIKNNDPVIHMVTFAARGREVGLRAFCTMK